eukprot:Opistho-2@57591
MYVLGSEWLSRQMFEKFSVCVLILWWINHAVGRISSVKPDKARAVEELIIRMARSGQLAGKVDEPQLISLLEQVGGAEKKSAPTVKFNRRKFDSDDEDLDL